MTSPGADTEGRPEFQSGEHERHLAIGALAQQGTHLVATLVMLAVVTAVGRTLPLPEFGVYGLLVSFTAYLLIAQISVEGAAVKAISEATTDHERHRAFTVALLLYLAAGVLASVLVVAGGLVAVEVLSIPADLQSEAREGVVALGAVMVLGWPLKTFQDALRGLQLFVPAAASEAAAYVIFGVIFSLLLLGDAPLWALVAVGASPPALIGACSGAYLLGRRVALRVRMDSVDRETVRSFLGLSGNLFALGISDLVIYSLDRIVLGAFRPAATIGLYEGPVRAHNLLRALNGTLVLTVLPAASRYLGFGDKTRARELLVRGTRYVVAAVIPMTVVLMVLSEPILHVWLGARFDEAAVALTLFASYWLLASSTAVAGTMLIAAGRASTLVRLAWATAAGNLAVSLALTPWLGLEGVVLGTAIPNCIVAPLILRVAVREFSLSLPELAREVWVPAFSFAVPLALGLGALRLWTDLDSLVPLVAVAAGGLAAYWAAYAMVWLKPGERTLARDIARTLLARARPSR